MNNVDLNSPQTENSLNSDINESLLSGSDFYVVKMADNTLRVYRWGTLGWFADNNFPITASVLEYWVRNDYIVIKINLSTLKVVKRVNEGWVVSDDFSPDNTNWPGSLKVIGTGNNFFVVAHNLRFYNQDSNWYRKEENISVIRWNGLSWNMHSIEYTFKLGKHPDSEDQHVGAVAGNDFFALEYTNENNPDFWALDQCAIYVRNGTIWEEKFNFQPDGINYGSDNEGYAYNFYAGSNYLITSAWRHGFYAQYPDNQHPERRNIQIFNWPFSSYADRKEYWNIDAFAGIYTTNNFFVTVGNSGSSYSDSQNPILMHSFNGNFSDDYPYNITNIGNLFTTTYKQTRLVLGKDYLAIGWIIGDAGKLGIIRNVNGQWTNSYVIETINDLGNDSYVTPVNNGLTLFTEWYSTGNYHMVRAYREQNNIWIYNTELDNIPLNSGIYDAHTFTQPGFQFLADVIKPGTTGTIISHGFTEGNTQGGGALFFGNPADYPVATKTVTDGMGNSYTTTYTFENGVYDHDLNFTEYNKVTVEPLEQDIGKTVTYFYNHLGPGQAEEFVYAVNYKELDGMPYKVKIYKQNDYTNPVSTTTNYWAAYAVDASKGVYHKRLGKTLSVNDGVTNTVEYEYNNTNGQVKKINEPIKVASELYGLRDRVTEITYACEQYADMRTLNMLSQKYESKIISKGSSSISVSAFADGPDITNYNEFSVLYNQTVTYEAIVSGGYFCIGTTQGGDEIVPKKYSDASGSFQANTGTYYLTAHTSPCLSPPHPCEAWVIGRVTYHQSTDPDEVVIFRERAEYDSDNNYLPFKSSVYDGTNWIITNTITKHNTNGNITENYNIDNIYSVIKYGYNNALPIARITNSKDGESGYTGLESGWQVWEAGGSTIFNTQKHTGSYSAYCTDNFGPTKNFNCSEGVDKTKSYELEAWLYGTGDTPIATLTIEMRNSQNQFIGYAAQETFQVENGWQLRSIKADPEDLINLPSDGYLRIWCGFKGSGRTGYVDDVRFYPADAMMTAYTYNPSTLQVTSGTDENNVTTFYEYDSFGRLIQTKNDDGTVLAQTNYYNSREHNGGNFNPGDPNYVRTSGYPGGVASTPVVTTTFADGLGRTLQSHSRNGSYDMISAVNYNDAGLPNKTYNPYSLSNPGHSYDPNYATSSLGFIETQYYSDPLGRVQWRIPQGSSPSTPNKNIESVYGNATLNGVACYTSDIKQKSATNSVNWITSRSYKDRLGRVVKSSVLDGTNEIQTSSTLYNMLGLPVQVTDPKEMQQNFTYDFLGRLKIKETIDAGTSKYIYDKAGRLRFMLDADGAAATPDNVLYWKYDKLGRVTEKGYIVINWGDGSALQNYANTDSDYPPTPATWRKIFRYADDGASQYMKGRLYKVETNNDNNSDVEVEETFAYNKYGFITAKNLAVMEVSTQMQSTLYDYDNLGRVTKITYPSRPENLTLDEDISGTIPQQYEANNNIDAGPDVTVYSGTSATFKAGTSIHLKPGFTATNGSNFRVYTGTFTDGGAPTEVVYTYNQRGLVSGVGTTTNPTYYASYTYKPTGQIETETLNDGQRAVNYSYNVKGYPTSINSALFTETLTYETGGYGGVGYYHGNIASASFNYYSGGPAAYQTLFQYDNLGRLKIADNNITALNQYDISNISYDANGNIISINKGGTNYTYNYYYETNKLKNTGGSNNDFEYDLNGNVKKSLPKGLDPIVYDPFTQMTNNITISGTPTHTVNFQYTADNERILKNEKQGTTNNAYVYIRGNSEHPITEKANLNNNMTDRIYIYGPTGLITLKDATATYFVIKDHLGSTRVLFRNTGSQYSTYDYSPFGSLMRATINGEVVYRFTGQEYDNETGLYNFRARLYDDELGIFYAVDPAEQGFTSYSYAGNNPVIFVDKDGRFWWIPVIIGAIIGGYSGYKIGEAQGAKGWQLFAYTFGGAVIGGVSGYLGYSISTSQALMANTMGLAVSSYTNSLGMAILSGGNMNPGFNFGAGSLDLVSGKVKWAFSGKETVLGYLSDALGVISNLNDITALVTLGPNMRKDALALEKAGYDAVKKSNSEIDLNFDRGIKDGLEPLGMQNIDEGLNSEYVMQDLKNLRGNYPISPIEARLPGTVAEFTQGVRFGRLHVRLGNIDGLQFLQAHVDKFNLNTNWLYHLTESYWYQFIWNQR